MSSGSRGGPSWAVELEQLRPALLAHLRRRGLGWIADDILGTVATELARYYHVHDSYEESDISGLIWRIVRFRARDELRRRFTSTLASAELAEEAASSEAARRGQDDVLDARRFLLAVASQLEEMTIADRGLLMRDLDSHELPPLTSGERVRLLRLRRELAEQVRTHLQRGKVG